MLCFFHIDIGNPQLGDYFINELRHILHTDIMHLKASTDVKSETVLRKMGDETINHIMDFNH